METYPNGQEAAFIANQSRKISQNSSNGSVQYPSLMKENRPGSRSPSEQNGDQEWVSWKYLKNDFLVKSDSKEQKSVPYPGLEPGTSGLEVQRAIHCASKA